MGRLLRHEKAVGFDDFRRQNTEADGRAFVSYFGGGLAVDDDSDGLFAGGDKLSRQRRSAPEYQILLGQARQIIAGLFLSPRVLHGRHDVGGLRIKDHFFLSTSDRADPGNSVVRRTVSP